MSDHLARTAYINTNMALDKELDELKQKKAKIAEAQPRMDTLPYSIERR